MKICFMRLEKCIAVRPTAAMMDIVGKILVEVISILGMAMKEIGQGLYRMPLLIGIILPKIDISRREIRQKSVWNSTC